MPREAQRWTEAFRDHNVDEALRAHLARIPGDLWERPVPERGELDLGAADVPGVEWRDLSSEADLDDLLPPVGR